MARYSLYRADELRYPRGCRLFRPDVAYPEYPFGSDTVSGVENPAYHGVREALRLAGLDGARFGEANWNPLGEYVQPGMRVLVKPNLVNHINLSGGGTECLYTHPSVIAAVLDYVVIALKGEGSIILADAPVQTCDFDVLVGETGLSELVDWYQRRGVDIVLKDMRGLKSSASASGLKQELVDNASGKVVDLGEKSSFHGLSKKRIDALRITNYDPNELKLHHAVGKHEYYVSDDLLEADVVVNLPKAKTHRKAGITGALKNMVGINVRKEYLPHHANGSMAEGFDEYEKPSAFKRLSGSLLDKKNSMLSRRSPAVKRTMSFFIRGLDFVGRRISGDPYREGGWYGNDTIWRTVLDLNKIVFHADRAGVMRDIPQRRMVVICDMITIGQGEGPLLPMPGDWRMLVFSDDPVVHDVALARLMGTDESVIPTIREALGYDGSYAWRNLKEPLPACFSNDPSFDGICVDGLNNDMHYLAKPASGWRGCFKRRGQGACLDESRQKTKEADK